MDEDRQLIEGIWIAIGDDCEDELRRALVHQDIKNSVGSPSKQFINSVIDGLIQKKKQNA